MLFSDFANVLLKLEHTNSRLEMTEILAKLFKEASTSEIDKAIYLLQGRLVPQYKSLEFGLAERLVFKAFVSSFSLNEKEARQRLQAIGDLGKTVEEFRKTNRSLFETGQQLSLEEIFLKLVKLAKLSGTGSQETKLGMVAELLQQLDPLSCRYLVRILVGTIRLGFSDMTILDSLSWFLQKDKSLRKQLEKAFNVKPDLGLLAKQIKQNGIKAIDKTEPTVGIPILMAKAERVIKSEQIIDKIGTCAIEPKYDGFRLQMHKSGKNISIFSRNLENIVLMFPDLVKAASQELIADNCIIEGEAVGYDKDSNRILPFQEIVQRKRKYNIEEKALEIPLKLFVFDLLYLNKRSYLQDSYINRRKALKNIISKKAQTIILAKEEIVDSKEKIQAIFEKAVKDGLEGIMAKKLSSPYQAGSRDWNWIKFKHSYSNKIADTVDCLIMGFDYGKGKRSGFGIGAFLVGVLNKQENSFVTIAKIGTGLTDKEWQYLKSQSNELITSLKPDNYKVNKTNSCDVWLKPSLVVEIRADEVSKSPSHTAGLALRFPRLEKFRLDKSPSDVTTLDELKNLYSLKHQSYL